MSDSIWFLARSSSAASTGFACSAAISSSMTARISSSVWPGIGEAVISKLDASSWLCWPALTDWAIFSS